MHPEHHPHSRVLAPDVGLPLPQLDVRIAQLENPGAVDAVVGGSRGTQINTRESTLYTAQVMRISNLNVLNGK